MLKFSNLGGKVYFIGVLILTLSSICSYGQNFKSKYCKENNMYGFIRNKENVVSTKNINWVIQPKYQQVEQPVDGWQKVKYKGKWGVVNLYSGIEIIACLFDKIEMFPHNQMAAVSLNGKWGYIHSSGIEVVPIIYLSEKEARRSESYTTNWQIIKEIPEKERREKEEKYKREVQVAEKERKANSFNIFANDYVESRIIEWRQRRGNESIAEWQKRTNENALTAKAIELREEAEQLFILERSQNFSIGNIPLGTYDRNKVGFPIKTTFHGDLLLTVSLNESQNFRDKWNNNIKIAKFEISNDKLALSEIIFISGNKTENYKFTPIEITISEDNLKLLRGQQEVATINRTTETLQNVQVIEREREIVNPTSTSTKNVSDTKGKIAIGVSPAIGLGGVLTNFGFCGKLRVQVANPILLEGSFTYFFPKEVIILSLNTEYKIWDFSLNMQVIITKSDKFSLYSFLGLGVLGLNATALNEKYSVSPVCYNIGAGFDVKLSENLFFNTEAKAIRLFKNDEYLSGGRFMISTGLVLKF